MGLGLNPSKTLNNCPVPSEVGASAPTNESQCLHWLSVASAAFTAVMAEEGDHLNV